jgi:type II secretory pathway pseudopilin PulG
MQVNFVRKSQGYTLIESLVALGILIAVIVPLSAFFYKQNRTIQAQQSLTALCLLEQEAALAVSFPEDVVSAKRRFLDGKEWTIRTEASGMDPIVYKMVASVYGRTVDSVVCYGRKADATKK